MFGIAATATQKVSGHGNEPCFCLFLAVVFAVGSCIVDALKRVTAVIAALI